jgi:hypothetical protein
MAAVNQHAVSRTTVKKWWVINDLCPTEPICCVAS